MRYLLMLFMIFISSNVQAYCYIVNAESANNTKIEDAIEIKLDSRNVFEKEVSMVFPGSFTEFTCLGGTAVENRFKTTYSNGNGEAVRYKINDGSGHRLYVDVTLFVDGGQTGKQTANATSQASKLNNQLKYKVLAKVVKVEADDSSIEAKSAGEVFLLGNYIKVKQLDCHGALICANNNTNHEYNFKVPIKISFTKTTCSLSNNEITLPPISLSDLLAGNAQIEYFPNALKFTCNGGLGMTTSIVSYHFSAVSATNGDYLANELTNTDSAKDVGFKIFLNNNLIHVNSDEKRQLLGYNKEMTEVSELTLGVQYYKYGNVQPGNVKSSVYIITSYQ